MAFDHSPISLQLIPKNRRNTGKVFRFESMWLKDPRCEDVVRNAWQVSVATSQEDVFNNYLKVYRSHLEAWNKTEFGYVGRKIAELQKHLEWLELQLASPTMIRDMKNTRLELNKWLEKEDAMWLQSSRVNWF